MFLDPFEYVMTRHQYGISALVSQTSFLGETNGCVAKFRLSFFRLGQHASFSFKKGGGIELLVGRLSFLITSTSFNTTIILISFC